MMAKLRQQNVYRETKRAPKKRTQEKFFSEKSVQQRVARKRAVGDGESKKAPL